jgi:Uncharacterised protein family, YAP/Alf4/glomulin
VFLQAICYLVVATPKMENAATASDEDPLIAALPPATDYITYLTLLEYQLNPQNLSTLNRLLSNDGGTLAEEIGWDLMRLVLPMLSDVPAAAGQCLDTIAQRGNPREVVVRLAEELEKLGRGPSGDFDDGIIDPTNDDEDGDGLPTFPGEAKRIHLGEMKLDGMPESEDKSSEVEDASEGEEPAIDTTQQDQDSFTSLLSMLCTVHPRIKTQYPSRFLATSLPAALKAYRRIPTSLATTKAFLGCLKALSAKQKPPLPPRTSTASTLAPNDITSQATVKAASPDPEASAEAAAGTNVPSSNEKSIISRLLQAVLLEVIDEYMSSLEIHEVQSMSWTIRSRERSEPNKLVPGKETETELWQTDEDFKQRDELTKDFCALAAELHLDSSVELENLASGSSTSQEEAKENVDEEEPSEYPTSPSQIPFAPTAVLLLGAASQSIATAAKHGLSLEQLSRIFHLITPLSESPTLPNPAVQDALHSLLDRSLIMSPPTKACDQANFAQLVSILTQTFSVNPHPQLRDDAHHLATKILHDYCDPETRLAVIKQTMSGSTAPLTTEANARPILLATPFTEGVLKAVGVDWLKNEILEHMKSSSAQDPQSQTPDTTSGISPNALDTDAELSDLVFPSIPAEKATSDSEDKVLLLLPFYISVLNLCCVVLSNTSSADLQSIREKAATLQSSLTPWLDHLLPQISQDGNVGQSAPEIFALDDASRRLKAIIDTKTKSVERM